ncbi:MAG: hypothetical protein GY941_09995 [Planctomycetes bacterium]|nr:hypothetical protein [Planctomycetota bacterium]
MKKLTPDEQLTYIIEQGKRVGLFPPDVDLAQAKRYLQTQKSHEEASPRYQPHSYRGKIILFKPAEGVDEESLDPDYGWGDYATEGVEIIKVPGNHRNMVKSPHVQALAEQLKKHLWSTQILER